MDNSAAPFRYLLNTWLRGVLFLPWILPEWDAMRYIGDNEGKITPIFSEKMRIRYETVANRGMALAKVYTFAVDQYARYSVTDTINYTFPETIQMYWRNMNGSYQ